MTPTLELRELRKAYRDTIAVDGVSFAVPPGTVFGLLGPNGAGKTTTLRMVMDIIAPDRGEVLFAGRPRTRADLERIGYLPEERGLYRRMTVIDHLGFLGELNGVPRREGNSTTRFLTCSRLMVVLPGNQRRRGLRASRSQSPSRFTDRAISTSITPGKMVIHHSPENR